MSKMYSKIQKRQLEVILKEGLNEEIRLHIIFIGEYQRENIQSRRRGGNKI